MSKLIIEQSLRPRSGTGGASYGELRPSHLRLSDPNDTRIDPITLPETPKESARMVADGEARIVRTLPLVCADWLHGGGIALRVIDKSVARPSDNLWLEAGIQNPRNLPRQEMA